MRILFWVKVVLFGAAAAAILSVCSLMIDGLIRPQRELLFLSLTAVVYVVVALFAAVGGLILSLVILIFRSFRVSVIVAVILGITLSLGLIEGAVEIYRDPTFFDAPMFYADIVQIILNLIIYPVVAALIWIFFGKEILGRY